MGRKWNGKELVNYSSLTNWKMSGVNMEKRQESTPAQVQNYTNSKVCSLSGISWKTGRTFSWGSRVRHFLTTYPGQGISGKNKKCNNRGCWAGTFETTQELHSSISDGVQCQESLAWAAALNTAHLIVVACSMCVLECEVSDQEQIIGILSAPLMRVRNE